MRELLGELLLDLNEPRLDLKELEASLTDLRNRLRGYYAAAKAAEAANDRRKAQEFYGKLVRRGASAHQRWRPGGLKPWSFAWAMPVSIG